MNTPLHGLLATALLDRRADATVGWAAFAGGIAPDVPAALFYGWYCLLGGHTGTAIWEAKYSDQAWELAADLSHSLVLAGVLLAVALWRSWAPAAAFAGGAVLHSLVDLATHADRAHRHLLPLSQWKLHGPWSTWDRAHGAEVVLAVEGALLLVCAAVVWRRYPHAVPRGGVVILLLWSIYWAASGRAFFET